MKHMGHFRVKEMKMSPFLSVVIPIAGEKLPELLELLKSVCMRMLDSMGFHRLSANQLPFSWRPSTSKNYVPFRLLNEENKKSYKQNRVRAVKPQARLRIKMYLIARMLWKKLFLRLIWMLKPAELKAHKRAKWATWRVLPRVVEYPFIIKNILDLKDGKILDVGCSESYLITMSAALGYEVYGIDVRSYRVRYPNVVFIRGSICNAPFPSDFFDVVMAISTIEHIGFKEPFGDLEDHEGDKEALNEMARILKQDGRILITVPYGRCDKPTWQRIYNSSTLNSRLLRGLKAEAIEYFANKNGLWVPVSQSEAEKMEASKTAANAVILLRISKPKRIPLSTQDTKHSTNHIG